MTCTFANTKQMFTIITLVCYQGQLYTSDVTMGVVTKASLASPPEGLDGVALCRLAGASYPGLEYGSHSISVDISPAP